MLAAVITELIDEPRMVIRVADDDLDTLSEKIDTITTRRGFAGKVVLLAEPSVARVIAGSNGPTAGWSGQRPPVARHRPGGHACWAATTITIADPQQHGASS